MLHYIKLQINKLVNKSRMHYMNEVTYSSLVAGAGSVATLSIFTKDVELGEVASSSLQHTKQFMYRLT